MEHARVAEQLGEAYVDCPVEFGTEADLRHQLVSSLEEHLTEGDGLQATVEDPCLIGSSPSYKREYRKAVESRLRDRGTLGRIRIDVSVGKGQRFDVGVFRPTLEYPVEWVRNGSKRFDERDLETVYDLKYIKNKCYPPTDCSITDEKLATADLESLRDELNTRENRLAGDLAELRELPGDVTAVFVLISNNNYLFAEPTTEAEAAEREKHRVGEAAREWIADAAGDTRVLYVHPLGTTWIT